MIMNNRIRTSIGFVLPSVLIVGTFVYAFIAWTVTVSFTGWNSMAPSWKFIGFSNYVNLLTKDFRFRIDLLNNFTFLPFFVIGTMALGFFLAVLLDKDVKFESFFRTVLLLPMAISLVVSGTIWVWLYDPSNGAIDGFLQVFHITAINWLGDMKLALPAIIITAIWQYAGFSTSIYLAGLRGIPQEILEAAKLDGAHGFRLYWNIIIPAVQSSTVTAFVLMIQLSLQMFDIVWVMTSGGPALATDMPAIYMFTSGFSQNYVAKSATIAVLISLFTLAVVIPYLFTAGRITEAEA